MGLKLCFISDTHGRHEELVIPDDIDIIIHCGDVSMRGNKSEIIDFLNWFSKQKARYRLFISGNHDFWFEPSHPRSVNHKLDDNSYLDIIPEGVIYLENSEVTIEGIKIWGSPVTPWFHSWAFNMMPEDLVTFWDQIPDDADIVITHGPCANTPLDKCKSGDRVGCPSLTKRIADIRPKILAFGHIHEAYGIDRKTIPDDNGVEKVTTLINCSVLNLQYYMANEPVLVDWEKICKLHENKKEDE